MQSKSLGFYLEIISTAIDFLAPFYLSTAAELEQQIQFHQWGHYEMEGNIEPLRDKFAIVDMITDHYLTQETDQLVYDQVPSVMR